MFIENGHFKGFHTVWDVKVSGELLKIGGRNSKIQFCDIWHKPRFQRKHLIRFGTTSCMVSCPRLMVGKKARMTHYFIKYGWPGAGPKDVEERTELVRFPQAENESFMDLIGGERIASS
ncbi:unnamed protein product [Calypogeia fissa]